MRQMQIHMHQLENSMMRQMYREHKTPYEVYYGGTTASATAMAYPAYSTLGFNPNTLTTSSSITDVLPLIGGINT